MADAFRGLTIRIGADARPLNSTISSISRAASSAQRQLNAMNKALKFDGANAAALSARLDLVSDKAHLSARSVIEIQRAMSQVDPSTRKMADNMRLAYSNTQKLNSAYNSVNAELEQVYDSVIKVVERLGGMDTADAVKYVKNLRKEMRGTGDEAQKARAWFKDLLGEAANSTGISKMFGLAQGDAKALEATVTRLIERHKELNNELEAAKAAEGYRAMRTQLIAWESSLREAASEAAKFRTELYSIGGVHGLQNAVAESRKLDAAIEKNVSTAKAMAETYRALPGHFDTALMKAIAFRNEEQSIKEKMDSLRKTMQLIEASGGFDRLAASSRDVNSDIAKLEHEFTELEVAAQKTETRIEELRRDISKLNEARPEGYKDDINKLEKEISSLNSELAETKTRMSAVDDEMKSASVQKTWVEARQELVKYEAELQKMHASTSRINAAGEIGGNLRTMGYGLYSTLTPTIMMAGRYAIQAANDIDSAYRDMRKTVQGTEQDFENLRNSAIEFSTTHITSAEEMLSIEAIGGQLGITVDELETFSKVVSDLSIATDDAFDTESIALWLGKMQNVLHITNSDLDNFADSLVRLGNSEPALESDIANITSRFASMANIVGMAPDEILAIATAATATGQKAESAGGSLMRIIGGIESAVGGVSQGMLDVANSSDEVDESVEALGAAGGKVQEYAKIAGMSADEFAKAWEIDPTTTFQKFVEGLKQVKDSGESVENVLQSSLGIGSIRDRQLLSGLTQTTDVLAESLSMSKNAFNGVADEFGDVGDAAREAEKKSQGFSGQLGIMKNNAIALGAEIAEGAVPFMTALNNILQTLTGTVRNMPDWTKSLIVGIAGLLAISGPAAVGIGSFLSGISAIKNTVEKFNSSSMFNKLSKSMTETGNASGILATKYLKTASAIEKSRGTLEKIDALQARHVKNLGTQSTALNTYRQNVEKTIKAQERSLKATSMASGALGVLKGIGGTVGVTAAIAGVEMLIEAFADAAEKAETYRKATDGVRDAANRVKSASEVAALGTGQFAESMHKFSYEGNLFTTIADEAAEKGAELADSINSTMDNAETNAILAEQYASSIKELAGNCDGSAEKVSELQNYVDEFNSITGSSISIVDSFTGSINAEASELDNLTNAFKNNVMAQAYGEVLKDTAKTRAELTLKLQEAEDVEQKAIQNNRELFDTYGDLVYQDENLTAQMEANNSTIDRSKETQSKLKDEIDATIDVSERATKAMFDNKKAAEESAKAYEQGRKDIEGYRRELDEIAGSSDVLDSAFNAATIEGFNGTIEEFVYNLKNAGIGAQELASIGADEFARLYSEADGDLSAIREAIGILNKTDIDPKTIHIDDGKVVDANGKVIALKDQVNSVNSVTGTATVYADTSPASNAIDNILYKFSQIPDSVSTEVRVFTTSESGKFAAGGIFPANASGGIARAIRNIPRHADGGLNGIITRPTLTNVGWVGEAGAEAILHMRHAGGAIVPLTNRKYVRPFASAVAAEMSTGPQQVTNIYIDGVSYEEGSREGITVKQLVKALGA